MKIVFINGTTQVEGILNARSIQVLQSDDLLKTEARALEDSLNGIFEQMFASRYFPAERDWMKEAIKFLSATIPEGEELPPAPTMEAGVIY